MTRHAPDMPQVPRSFHLSLSPLCLTLNYRYTQLANIKATKARKRCSAFQPTSEAYLLPPSNHAAQELVHPVHVVPSRGKVRYTSIRLADRPATSADTLTYRWSFAADASARSAPPGIAEFLKTPPSSVVGARVERKHVCARFHSNPTDDMEHLSQLTGFDAHSDRHL